MTSVLLKDHMPFGPHPKTKTDLILSPLFSSVVETLQARAHEKERQDGHSFVNTWFKDTCPSLLHSIPLGQSSFQAPSLFGPKLLVLLHIKVVTELWLLLLLFDLGLSFPEPCTPLLWGQRVQVHRHLRGGRDVYMAQVEGTRTFSRVSTSPCYLPHSLGLMCSVGFSLPLKLF